MYILISSVLRTEIRYIYVEILTLKLNFNAYEYNLKNIYFTMAKLLYCVWQHFV